MGKVKKLRDLIGVIKDKASLSKAALLSKPNTLSLHVAVLRATTHSSSTPPDVKHLESLLSLGDASRATASALVESLMDRLHRTGDSSVVLKCLLTIHHIINRGPFILQDQLSIFPSFGGHNYLKLSAFRDGATATTWVLSAWVRWYARYLETLLSTSRTLGFFLCSCSSTLEKDKQDERLSSFMTVDLIRDVDSLVGLIEEICKAPDSLHVEGNRLLDEIMGLVGGDYLSAVNEVSLRLSEFMERLSCLSFGESVELMCCLNRLEDCKERLVVGSFTIKKPSTETLWGLIRELKNRVGMIDVYRESGKLGFVGMAKDLNAIVIAFRGTQERSLQNWIEDLYWKQLDLNYPGMPDAMVHHGFYFAYHNTTVRSGVVNAVKRAKQLYGDIDIMVTGHSMGGAMAVFCGLDLKVNHEARNVQVMTFGQPRIGNAAFASYYSQLVPNTIRVTNDHDIVPHLPSYYPHFAQKTYHHFPREVWIHQIGFGTLVYKVEKVCDGSGEDPSCSSQENDLETTGKTTMVINNEVELLGKQQEIKPGGKVAYQKEGSLNEICRSLTTDAKINHISFTGEEERRQLQSLKAWNNGGFKQKELERKKSQRIE
ncbi:hypothetical protein TEA_006950 [Camellia sinensis var. sinensis]|uniref:ENTH domain-containing protein n=1 Tax=Camellia sinensis var. sinensis TaxID=542762 RepID=A0A4S4DL40_CAMSN|nr:hypothetical protein TEA_006950 [Camellia sinensis var. sinensis]